MDKNLEKTGTGLAELSIRDLKYEAIPETAIRQKYSDDFKNEVVQSYLNGKPRKKIIDQYNIPPSTLHSWINEYKILPQYKEEQGHSKKIMIY